MPVNGDRLGALVDDCHRDIISLVLDEMGSRSLTVDEPGRASDAVGVIGTIGDLETAAVKRNPCEITEKQRTVRVC